jgi:hypothetical protein
VQTQKQKVVRKKFDVRNFNGFNFIWSREWSVRHRVMAAVGMGRTGRGKGFFLLGSFFIDFGTAGLFWHTSFYQPEN